MASTPSATNASPPGGTPSGPAPAAGSMYVRYAQSLMKKYDRNGDGALTEDEWKNMSNNPQAADADHNGKVTVEELVNWLSKQR